MRENHGPDVRESSYVADTAGPPQDTESYYKHTPAPAGRAARPLDDSPTFDTLVSEDAPPDPNADPDTGWIRREALRQKNASNAGFNVPWLAISLAAGLAIAIVGMTGVIAVLAWNGSGDPPSAAAADPADPETWQGLRVKKGLR